MISSERSGPGYDVSPHDVMTAQALATSRHWRRRTLQSQEMGRSVIV